MDATEWSRNDKTLLRTFAKVREKRFTRYGGIFNEKFYGHIAARYISEKRGRTITKDDVAERIRHHRSVYQTFNLRFYQIFALKLSIYKTFNVHLLLFAG